MHRKVSRWHIKSLLLHKAQDGQEYLQSGKVLMIIRILFVEFSLCLTRVFGSFVRVFFWWVFTVAFRRDKFDVGFSLFFNDLCLTGVSHFGCRKHAASPGKRPEPCQFKFTGQQREKNSTPEYAFYVRLN